MIGLTAAAVIAAQGQVLLSTGTPYVQNFDTLASSSAHTNASAPWTNNVTLAGWYARAQASSDYHSYRASGGEHRVNGIYSFGTNGAAPMTDRALGSIASSSPKTISFGVRFQNDTKNFITNIAVTYTGEQWRNSTDNGSEQTLRFSYKTGSSPMTNPSDSSGWIPLSALNFIRLHYGGEAGPLDGNAPGNRKQFSNEQLPGVSLKPGDELFLRWEDVDDEGQNDHGLAIDDVTVSFTAAAPAR